MAFQITQLCTAPVEERCASVGSPDYDEQSMLECLVFRRFLQRLFPVPEEADAHFIVSTFPHDFGHYREVCVRYRGAPGADFATKVENDLPHYWDEVAKAELAWFRERRRYVRALLAGEIVATEIPELYQTIEPPRFVAELQS